MMATIPVQLSNFELAKIDYLVKIGRYKNRTQAIIALLRSGIREESLSFDWEDPLEEGASQALIEQMLRDPETHFVIKGQKSAHDLLAEERERY